MQPTNRAYSKKNFKLTIELLKLFKIFQKILLKKFKLFFLIQSLTYFYC